jgi:hypothetical protein
MGYKEDHTKDGKPAERMDDSDLEFLQAVDRFRQTKRRFPLALDYKQILMSLGYSRN